MLWHTEMIQQLALQLLAYSSSMVLGNLVYKFIYESYHEFNNITLRSVEMKGIIRLLITQKFQKFLNLLQIGYIALVFVASFASQSLWEIIFKQSHFWMVFIATILLLIASSKFNSNRLDEDDAYKYFIRNSGLDCGSFMAYSFYHGYIKYVVASNSDVSSKGLVERMTDYEAKHKVTFPIKKLLILQPQSMFIPPTLISDVLQNAENLEEVRINRGGVVDRSYQLSVYKLEGPNWYVNVQGASPLLTFLEESKRAELLEKYKGDVAKSFRRHLERLIWNDLRCRGLVEVIYYNDLDEHGERIDVGVMLKKYIEESLQKKALNGRP